MALRIPLRLLSAVRRLQADLLLADSSSADPTEASVFVSSQTNEQSAASPVTRVAEAGVDSGAECIPPEAAMAMLGGEISCGLSHVCAG